MKKLDCYNCKHKRNVAGNAHIECVKPDKNMRGNARGVARGWFYYPSLLDPVWAITECSNFERKD
jgi:hypothetical protein